MALSYSQKQKIEELLSKKIEHKLEKYGRETTAMPFLARLIQDNEKIAAYSFIHSISTTLGMSVYEDVSVILASETADEAFRNYGVGGVISNAQKTTISNIISNLRNGTRTAEIDTEIQEVLNSSTKQGKFQKSGNIADFYMKKRELHT